MTDSENVDVHALVREIHSQLGSKRQLCERMRLSGYPVSERTVSRWETSENTPSADVVGGLVLLAQSLSIDVGRFSKRALSVYDFSRTYEENIDAGPINLPGAYPEQIPSCGSELIGTPLNSPVGIPASILTANSRWIAPFANAGYDVIEYKTVRTREYRAHSHPNLAFVSGVRRSCKPVEFPEAFEGSRDEADRSTLANSLGMPSKAPHVWQPDVEASKRALRPGQVLLVSVVGTQVDNGRLPDLIADFVHCAELATETDPFGITLNLSCPNALRGEGLIYQDLEAAVEICRQVRKVCRSARLFCKIGYLQPGELDEFFEATHRMLDGFIAINTRPAEIHDPDAQPYPGGIPSPMFASRGDCRLSAGVSGLAIRDSALEVVRGLSRLRCQEKREADLAVVGVGGVSSPEDADSFLDAGANVVQICTAVMFDVMIGARIRQHWAAKQGDQGAIQRDSFDGFLKACDVVGCQPRSRLDSYLRWEAQYRSLSAMAKQRQVDSWAKYWNERLRSG